MMREEKQALLRTVFAVTYAKERSGEVRGSHVAAMRASIAVRSADNALKQVEEDVLRMMGLEV